MTQLTVFGAVPPGSGQQVLDDLNLSDQALATEHEGDEAPAETYPWMRWRTPQRRQQRPGNRRELRRDDRPWRRR